MRRTASSIVYLPRSRTQWRRNHVGSEASMMRPDVRARVAETDRHPGVVEQLLDRIHLLVEEGIVEERAPLGLERDADERLCDRLAVPLRVRGERSLRVGAIVDVLGGEDIHTSPVERGSVALVGRPDQLGPAPVVAQSRRGARRARAAATRSHSGVRSKNVRCCRPKSSPMPRAVVCGRSSPPRAPSSSHSSRILRNSSGPALLCASPNVTGRPVRRLISAIQCTSARVPS